MSVTYSVSGKIKIGLNTYEDNITNLTITKNKSASLTWSCNLYDLTASEMNSIDSVTLAPQEEPTANQLVEITRVAKSSAGTLTGTFSNLLLTNVQILGSSKDGVNLSLSGVDYSYLLQFDSQTHETYESQYLKDIFIDILDKYNIDDYDFQGDLDDILTNFPVQQMDFQNTRPIDRIQTGLNEVGAFWRMNGDQFVGWISDTDSIPAKTFTLGVDIESFSHNEESMQLYDKIKCTRISKNANIAAQSEGNSLGEKTISLSGTFRNVLFQVVHNIGCTIPNTITEPLRWFYEGDWQGSGYGNSGPVDQCKFWVVMDVGATSYEYKIKITGVPEIGLMSGIDLDAQYEKTLTGYDGNYPYPDLQSNFTSTDEIAELKCNAFLREQGSKKNALTITTFPQLSSVELDDRVTVDFGDFSKISGIYNVESITKTVSGAGGIDSRDTYTLKRYIL